MHPSYIDLDTIINSYTPPLPKELQKAEILTPHPDKGKSHKISKDIKTLFPHTCDLPYIRFSPGKPSPAGPLKVGVMLSGGPAPGGHNVIQGLLDSLKKFHQNSQLIGFLNDGEGLTNNNAINITKEFLYKFRNSGGFNCLGTGRKNIVSQEGKESCLKTIRAQDLDGLVIIGGDGSNTATAILAEYLAKEHPKTSVVGVPKTIDGDLQHDLLDLTFGFDTATKFYSSIISNISRDALSCKAHYHFIKLMGRSASHITLECALQTHPNIALIGEEIAAKNLPLKTIIHKICSIIADRAAMEKYYGVILIPEGIIEFIPEITNLIREIEALSETQEKLSQLSPESQELIHSFPPKIIDQLLYDRDAHGNVYVSKISVEKLLIHLVKNHLQKHFKTVPFNAVSHFLGYEGRSGIPTKFDNDYGYSLGFGAGVLVRHCCNGYLSTIESLACSFEKWRLRAIPIVKMLTLKRHSDSPLQPKIKKHLVDISSPSFKKFKLYRKIWALEDSYRFLGPLQLQTPPDTHSDNFPPLTLLLNHNHWQHQCHMCIEIPDGNY
ncbi:diphosphate--fructose-6-phosphate 1-phosphotransferase [Chlamydia pecorum]|uniref:Probable ATP-dependent 6-phosphofructokinase n=2 Tax=Chlamydia pecorum TaxID=85991 RepID=A0AA34RDV0_CHLPE|nr:diphosphate--fructose-6-phosphate 1-phosphotransferase [Chlamydia pecorum]AEB41904.1 fructose-6-P phosphotransferase [Chlamydia pecorum E58]ETF37088.1 fructose-6-P phosphotransferase [Chlamydia pecorum MC/MarsBar]ETF39457.1 fructose-6-P phosphotransferase [Chlamydia pecorum IPTaLE]KTF28408.1 diphosphate--fructose-6-phosphate 1-phosphotransferase [Chlamydia pecorum]KZN27100.1 diphosphate--fructose-6-phosphate 1-phosphotransferase [Chlamydia pecorum]